LPGIQQATLCFCFRGYLLITSQLYCRASVVAVKVVLLHDHGDRRWRGVRDAVQVLRWVATSSRRTWLHLQFVFHLGPVTLDCNSLTARNTPRLASGSGLVRRKSAVLRFWAPPPFFWGGA